MGEKHYRVVLIIITVFVGLCVSGQDYIKKQLPTPIKYDPTEIIDSIYGITLYEKLNFRLGGDSVRNCGGYACEGWIEDHYKDGSMNHRGYYVDGHLKIYKNYFPNGQLERDFRIIDDYKSIMRIYYKDGTLKSEIRYNGKDAYKWQDFYSNGQLEYYEEYNKGMDYYVAQKSYFKDGKPENILELDNKKKRIFLKKEYYPNGQVKEEGILQYSMDLFDYRKVGKWSSYNEDGKLIKDTFYENGKIHKEKKY
ncbi:MAG: toxin-antitoxin system YwqK family antitoxin [Flavobacteriales bacterium]